MVNLLKRALLPVVCLLFVFSLLPTGNIGKIYASEKSNNFWQFANQLQLILNEYNYEDDFETNINSADIIKDGNTSFVKAEAFSRALGLDYNLNSNTITLTKEEKNVTIPFEQNVVNNEEEITLFTHQATFIKGEAYLPLDDTSKVLNYEVVYEDFDIKLVNPYASKRVLVCASGNLDSFGAIKKAEGYNNLHIFQYKTETDLINACEQYKQMKNVVWWQVDNLYSVNDVVISSSYSSWGADSMGVGEYSDYLLDTIGSSNFSEIIIAVLDTGIDSDHSFFTGRIASGGKNFSSTAGSGVEYEDVHGHGTHVSGILCDLTFSNVKILPIKVMSDNGYGFSSQIMLGIEYVTQLKNNGANIKAMNLSLGNSAGYVGSDEYNSYYTALGSAYSAGILPVVAAGNDGANAANTTPANIDFAMTVAAVGQSSSTYYHPSWSNYGDVIDVSAPGYSIVSAAVGGGTVALSGTSMAAPHVAGVVGLLLTANPNLSLNQLENMLTTNVIDLGTQGKDIYFGYGMVYVEYAYAELLSLVTFSNTNRDCVEPFELTLSAENNTVIYYTTDGSIPDINSSTLYTSPITISSTQVVKARAYRISGDRIVGWSNVSEMTYCFYGQDVSGAYTVDNGVITQYNGVLTNIVVPMEIDGITITAIGENAFSASDVETVILPSTVTTIGRGAFQNCENLTMISAPAVTTVDMYAFNSCVKLQYVNDNYFPELTSIGKYAFYRCFELRDIVLNKVEIVDYWAFGMKVTSGEDYSPQYLTRVSLLNANIIAEGAFIFCNSLSTLELPNIKIIASEAFRDCDITYLSLPACQYLGNRAFYVNENLYSASLPEVLVIGEQSFYYHCKQLTNVYAPKLEIIGKMAFRGCTALTQIDFPNLKQVFSWAFYDCDNLISVSLPKAKYIGYVAFGACDKLETINLCQVGSVFDEAFRACPMVNEITLSSCIEYVVESSFAPSNSCTIYYYSGTIVDNLFNGSKYNKIALNNGSFIYTINNDEVTLNGLNGIVSGIIVIPSYIEGLPVVKIGANAFSGNSNIRSLDVTYVTEIGENAFLGCENLSVVYLPRIETIGNEAFKDCSNLEEVNIENVKYVGNKAFFGCDKLLSINLSENIEYIGTKVFGFVSENEIIPNFVIFGYENTQAQNYAQTHNITFRALFRNLDHFYYNTYLNTQTGHTEIYISFVDSYLSGNFTLPNQYNGMVISKIGDSAFENCSLITAIKLPSTITTIGVDAFYGCSSLRSINLDYITQVDFTSSNHGVFQGCALTSINMPLLTYIPNSMFSSCGMLSEVTAPLVVEIGDHAFYECSSLKRVYAPNVEIINQSAFGYDKQLSSITTQKVKTLGTIYYTYDSQHNITGQNVLGSIFAYCESLTTLYLPNVETLGLSLFSSSMEKVAIGNKLTSYESTSIAQSISIYGYNGSLAQTYANQNGNVFVAIDNFSLDEDLPSALSVDLGQAESLSVTASGFDLKYYWYVSGSQGYSLLPTGQDSISINTFIPGEFTYYVRVVNWDGEEIESNHCVLTIVDNGEGFVITVSNGANGSISPESCVVAAGGNITFTFTPDLGYYVSNITIDGVALSSQDMALAIQNGYTFTNVVQSHAIYAEFSIKTFIITITTGDHVSANIEGNIVCNYGQELRVNFSVDVGYVMSSVIVDGVQTSLANSFTFSNITANHTLSVTVIPRNDINYTVKHYVQSLTSSGAIYVGQKYYTLLEADNKVGSTGELTNAIAKIIEGMTAQTFSQAVIVGDGSTVVNIYYNRNEYSLTLLFSVGITGVTGVGEYLYGESVTISASVNQNYNFISWVSSYPLFSSITTPTASFIMPAYDLTLTARCELKTYEIEVISGEHGRVESDYETSAGEIVVTIGESVTFAFEPDEGYYISQIKVDSVTLNNQDLAQAILDGYTFTNVNSAHMLQVEFSIYTYTISVTAGEHILTSLVGTTTCDYGQDVNLFFSLENDYVLDSFIVDGVNIIPEDNVFTISAVKANHALVVSAKLKTYNIVVSSTSQTKGEIVFEASDSDIVKGESRSFTVVPLSGYVVESVYINGVLASGENNVYQINDITDDVEIEVNYADAEGDNLLSGGVNQEQDISFTKWLDKNPTALWTFVISIGLNIVLILMMIIIGIRRKDY